MRLDTTIQEKHKRTILQLWPLPVCIHYHFNDSPAENPSKEFHVVPGPVITAQGRQGEHSAATLVESEYISIIYGFSFLQSIRSLMKLLYWCLLRMYLQKTYAKITLLTHITMHRNYHLQWGRILVGMLIHPPTDYSRFLKTRFHITTLPIQNLCHQD